MHRIILATAALLGTTTAAHAELVSLAVATVSAFLATPVIGTLTLGTALQLAVLGGSIAYSLFAPGPKQQAIDPGEAKSTFETADGPELRCIGRVRIGGQKLYGNTNGIHRYRLIGHCKGPIDGVEAHYLGGREVVVEENGAVSSPPFAANGSSWVFIRSKIGDGTETAWTYLMSAFAGLWTADHRVRGIAQTLIEYVSPGMQSEKFLKLYQSGPPDYERVQRCELLYDPRTETTAWSDNGVLGVLHIMLTFPDLTLADFDLAYIAGEADRADEVVATKTGSEPRSRCWGVWNSEIERGDLLQQVLDSTGTEVIIRPGELIGIRLIDDVRTPEFAFPERHGLDLSWKSGPDSVERPNLCALKYYSPERNFDMAEINLEGTSWHRIEDEIARYGEKKIEIALPFCPSAAQAQRIARRKFEMARADTGILQTNMVGLAVWEADCITIPIDPPYAPVCLISAPRVNDDDGMIEIPYSVMPVLAPWNVATDEANPPEPIPELAYETLMTQPAMPLSAIVVTLPDTSKATRLFYVVPGDATVIEATYRVYAGAVPGPWLSMTEVGGLVPFAHVAADLAGELCDFRIRGWNAEDDGSLWSPTLQVTPADSESEPDAPAIGSSSTEPGTTITISVTAPDDHDVTHVETTGPDSPGIVVVNPGEVITWQTDLPDAGGAGSSIDWTAQAFSGATGSDVADLTIVIPGA